MSIEDFYRVSTDGKAFIKRYETGKDADGNLLPQGEPALTAYDDGFGNWTIGWGHTLNVNEGDTITRAQAEAFLDADLERIVQPALQELAEEHTSFTYPNGLEAGFSMTQQQVDAVASLMFNVVGNLATTAPRAWSALRVGDFDQYLVQMSEVRTAGGAIVPGLEDRRADEAELFVKNDYARTFDHINGIAGSVGNPYAPNNYLGPPENPTGIPRDWFIVDQNREWCFLPHTPITLADGTTKPIAAIRPGDMVLSPDKTGALVPARVTRTFVNDVAHVLDFHGTGVTPGHVFLCGEGRFQGRHVPLIDILRDDGAVVRQDGSLMRASTGCAVGSDGDRLIEVVAADGTRRWLRAGTRVAWATGEVTCCEKLTGAMFAPRSLYSQRQHALPAMARS
ncbi:MAG: glycoside hydrolase family protein [Rhodobacter sp.]|nr:glycoside hydrolase family protein [Rhodobacter sp.]MCA3501436.1 glycoside hydrolase family protein [Rhodobacter sp.]